MTVERDMSLAVVETWREIVKTGGEQAMSSRRWMLQQETSERRPMVVRRYGGTRSWSVDDDRRRRRDLVGLIPERVDSSTLAPYRVVLDMPWVPVWSRPVPEDAASGVGLSRGRRSRGRSDEVETPNELQRWVRPGGVAEDRQELRQVCRTWNAPATPQENVSSRWRRIDADGEAAVKRRSSVTQFFKHGWRRQGRCPWRRPSHGQHYLVLSGMWVLVRFVRFEFGSIPISTNN